MDLDHQANCHWRLFSRKCTCNAVQRAQDEQASIARMTESGVMPLASEIAEQKEEIERLASARVEALDAPEPYLAVAITEALGVLTEQGLTVEEALKVVERRILAK